MRGRPADAVRGRYRHIYISPFIHDKIHPFDGLFFATFVLQAQTYVHVLNAPDKLRNAYKEAYLNFTNGKTAEGIKQMEKILKKNPEFINPYLIVGDAYMTEANYPKALEWFRKAIVVAPDYEAKVYLLMGNIFMETAKYDSVETYYKKFLSFPKISHELAQKARKGILDAPVRAWAYKNPVNYKPINLGAGINTPAMEYFPVVTADENTLVYTRQDGNTRETQEDLYVSKKKDGVWQTGVPVEGVNTPDNEGAQTISANGKLLVFTVCNRAGDFGSCDLYFSEFRNGAWTKPKNMGAKVNSDEWESQPSLSPHADELYFSRGNPRNKSSNNLWVSRRDSAGAWQKPTPIAELNTDGQDAAPCIHPDGKTLYFVSDGYGGLGELDIFITRKGEDGKFSKPQNMGFPINTPKSEVALTVSRKGDLAYIASEKEGGMGKYDIYSFELDPILRPQPVTYAEIIVYDANTKKVLPDANLDINKLPDAKLFLRAKTDRAGEFLACLPLLQDYALNVQKAGYLFHSENFALKESGDINKPYQLKVYLQPIPQTQKDPNNPNTPTKIGKDSTIGKPIVLKNVFFATNSAELRPESKNELDRLYDLLTQNADMRILLGGHTDNEGDDKKNQLLSENRAKSVREYLIQKGINADRLKTKGYGETSPVDTNDTPAGRANNRRTDFSVLANN